MKWYAISGSWRTTNDQVKKDVEYVVQDIIDEGSGIVTGGALGVDYIATQKVISCGNPRNQLKIYLPIPLEEFCKHYYRRANENVITLLEAEMITTQLKHVQELASHAIFDNLGFQGANKESYYARNSLIIQDCDELFAFQVNDSQGTQDAINKAMQLNKPTHVKRYHI